MNEAWGVRVKLKDSDYPFEARSSWALFTERGPRLFTKDEAETIAQRETNESHGLHRYFAAPVP